MKTYSITPVAKPRMTQRDRWKKRSCVIKYFEFKDQVRKAGLVLPPAGAHVIFCIPMPKSWSKKKKLEMNGSAHMQTPDWDNLGKALSDAVYGQDCVIWDIRISKKWSIFGMIEIR